MSRPSVAFFLPTRKGSERVKDKNTRPFAGVTGGLVENKIRQLLAAKKIDEIIFSSNDEKCIAVAEKYSSDSRVKIIPRPDSLCLGTTNLQDLIRYVPTVTESEHILWGHVTTPLVCGVDYDNAIGCYLEKIGEGYDSLVGVRELKNFLMNSSGKLINNTTAIPWPRTQDLEPLYEINHTMFIANRGIYIKDGNRLGGNPYLYAMDVLKSQDIDWPWDFKIAELLYENNILQCVR